MPPALIAQTPVFRGQEEKEEVGEEVVVGVVEAAELCLHFRFQRAQKFLSIVPRLQSGRSGKPTGLQTG
jgi:hypothetical protein